MRFPTWLAWMFFFSSLAGVWFLGRQLFMHYTG